MVQVDIKMMAYYQSPWNDTDVMLQDPTNAELWPNDFHTARCMLRIRAQNLINRLNADVKVKFQDFHDETCITFTEKTAPGLKTHWNGVLSRAPDYKMKCVELWMILMKLIQDAPTRD